MSKTKNKRKIKKQVVFNLISILVISIFATFYLGRFIYYYKDNQKEVIYSDILAEQIVERVGKYEIEEYLIEKNNIYRFVGEPKYNYVKFNGYTWRIIKINEDKSITMIMDDSIIALDYGNVSEYKDSQINKWLNKQDNVQYSGIFNNIIAENLDLLTTTKTCNDKFNKIESIECYEVSSEYQISLLSMNDYAEAGGANSYLNNGTYFWTTNLNKDNQFWYISDEGSTGVAEHDEEYGVRPVITLKPGVKVIRGSGTNDDPYIIEEKEINALKDAYIGQYIILNDSLWRIVEHNGNATKVVSEEYMKDADGNDYLMTYSTINHNVDLNDETTLLYYLNNTYYKNFKEKNLLVKGSFYDGGYVASGNYDYTSTYNSKFNAYVGLLSIAEPFVYDLGNVFTSIVNVENELTVYVINEEELLFEDSITNQHYVRPSVYVKNTAVITEGEGTYLSPYKLGSENDGEA